MHKRKNCIEQARAAGVAWDIIYTHDWEAVAILLDLFEDGTHPEQLTSALETENLRLLHVPRLHGLAYRYCRTRSWGSVIRKSLVITQADVERCKYLLTDRARLIWWQVYATGGVSLREAIEQTNSSPRAAGYSPVVFQPYRDTPVGTLRLSNNMPIRFRTQSDL